MHPPASDHSDESLPAAELAETCSMSSDEPAAVLVRVLDDYLADLDAGRRPDRDKLLAEYPELASQLEPCFAGLEFIHRAAAPTTGVPQQLGDFRIVREVGRGGMGVVYEAEQISLKRRIALKVLRYGAAADTEAMQRFQREAETVAGLHHTNIVPIFAIGSEQGVNYYAMQFIDGRSLAEELKEKSRQPHQVAAWGLQAAEALAHAHQRGVVHRDIKPSNLILDPDGRLWLTDFGLAKRLDDVTLSLAGTILGTPRYMSPEQASSVKHPVDHRTDLYSLGATLYELVTGRPVFDADTAHGVITQILTAIPPAPRLVRPDVPRDFETIILKCLAKEPAQRYATAQALANDLRAFVEGRAIKARRATLTEQAARWLRQQKRSVGIAVAAVAATIVVVTGSLIAWQMHSQSRLGYLTINTPREGEQRAEVAEVLSLDDEPVGPPFTLPTKEPLALPAGAYRLRLTAPSKVSQTYLFDVSAGAAATHEVGLVNETVGYPISLRSPVGVEVVESFNRNAIGVRADGQAPTPMALGSNESRLFVGPQDQSKPTLRCYSGNSQPGWNPDGSRASEVAPLWEANWSVDSPLVAPFLKTEEDKTRWKQVVAWFDLWWFRNGASPKLVQPARDLDGDGVEDLIWIAPRSNGQGSPNGPGQVNHAAAMVAASGKDGRPLWWFWSYAPSGPVAQLATEPVWVETANRESVLVCVFRSSTDSEEWVEAIAPQTGKSLWQHNAGSVGSAWLTTAMIDGNPSVVAVIQNRLFVLDAATGEPKSGTPASLDWNESGKIVVKPEDSTGLHKGTVRLADVRFAELDGDGVPEVLLSVFVQDQRVDVIALSLARREALWQVTSSVAVGPNDPFKGPLPWPFIADLDDDDRAEVIVPNHGGYQVQSWTGCRVLNGATGDLRWERRFPVLRGGYGFRPPADHYTVAPDLDGDGQRELVVLSIRKESHLRAVGSLQPYQHEEHALWVDCFSGRDGSSVWWQRIPLGLTEYSAWTGTVGEPIWWDCGRSRSRKTSDGGVSQRSPNSHDFGDDGLSLVIPVHRHPEWQGDGGTHSIYVVSAATGRIEHQADDVTLPRLVDWNNDGLDDLAVFVPDDPARFANRHYHPDKPGGKFVVLRGSPPEAFRRLDRWTEEQDFDGDGIAELSKRHDGGIGDYALLIASGRDGRILSKWKTEWPETPREFTVGDVQSFPPPLGDFDEDGLSDLLISREQYNWDFELGPLVKTGQAPLLIQAISSKTGKRIWGGVPLALPDWLRPKNADENSEDWMQQRNGRLHSVSTQAVDVDGDGRPEVLQALRLTGYRQPEQDGSPHREHQQPFVALIDARAGTLRWFEPISEIVVGDHAPGLDYLRIDASTDLNGDSTRDLVVTVPQQAPQGSWSLSLQVHNGRDGKMLWGPKLLEGTSVNNNDFNSPIVSDLDGDGRPEIVLMPSKEPKVAVLRGDSGEQLWTWQGSQPQYFQSPGIAVVASRLGLRPDPDRTVGTESQPTTRCVAVAFNETGSQWNLVLLDHKGQLVETVPCPSNQLWSHDLDGDGGEELLRQVDNKIVATRGLHDVLWTWSLTPQSYGWISHMERTNDGRVIVVMSGNDSVTLLDGSTGKPLGRTFKSTNTSLQENNRMVDLNRPKLNSTDEVARLLTRVGDGQVLLGHVVSRAVLPTDDDGRYRRMGTLARPDTARADDQWTGKSAHPTTRSTADPRLVRRLMWAPTPAEWATSRSQIFRQVFLAVALSLIVVLTPYWLIRAGIRRRELGRWRIALIGGGIALLLTCLTLMRFPPPGYMWHEVPWALPFALAVGGLPILLYPAAMLRAFVNGDWRRIRWLVIGTILLAALLGAVQMAIDLSRKLPEQHYSWFGWWMIFVMGAYFTGGCLVLGHVFGPGVRWFWNRIRRQPSAS